MKGKVLIIQLRNLGDAIVTSKIVNSLKLSFPNISIDLLIRKEFFPIFKNNPYIQNIYFANYPVGTRKNFKLKDFFYLVVLILKLRKKYNFIINNIGDFREDFLGKVLKPKKYISPSFSKKHSFSSYIRQIHTLNKKTKVFIPEETKNIYDIQTYFLKALGCSVIYPPKIFFREEVKKENVIGIHPLASMKSKMWNLDKWVDLIKKITETFPEYSIYLFGAPNERSMLENLVKDIKGKKKKIHIKTGNLEEFFYHLSKVKVLVGLDSFSIHAAYALNIPSIAIFGSSDYEVFKPPSSYVIAKGKIFCSYYPCNNKPMCLNSDFEYICLENVAVEDVFKKLKDLLK